MIFRKLTLQLICVAIQGRIQGGNLGVKTPPSMEIFFNYGEKFSKHPINFEKLKHPLKNFLDTPSLPKFKLYTSLTDKHHQYHK